MTKVIIRPGPCNFVTSVTAESEDGLEVKLTIKSGCESVRNITANLGDTFDAFSLCLAKPGTGPLYDYARERFPGHACCVVLNGIIKCVEAECGLALPTDAGIEFVKK